MLTLNEKLAVLIRCSESGDLRAYSAGNLARKAMLHGRGPALTRYVIGHVILAQKAAFRDVFVRQRQRTVENGR